MAIGLVLDQVASNVIAYVIFWLLLGFEENSGGFCSSDADKFRNLALICIFVGAGFAALFQLGVDEPKMPDLDAEKKASEATPNRNPKIDLGMEEKVGKSKQFC